MDRRRFLGIGSAAMASLAVPRCLKAQACPSPTTADRYGYGPYYLEGAPERRNLAKDAPGHPITILGRVSDCQGPVAGVAIEIWHATAAGCYIHPSLPACADRGDPENSRHWGRIVTGADGAYGFSTVKPGVYLNGSRYRPSHIHFRIRSPEGRVPRTDLVTQLYFEGDPYLSGDAGADDPGAQARIIPFTLADGGPIGNFDITIPGGAMGLRERRDPFSDPSLRGFDAFVQRSGDVFRIFLPPVPAGTQVEARLYDAAGVLFRRSLHSLNPIELDAALWPRGAYQATFLWHAAGGVRSEGVSLRR
jgi:protocatechuate 3,4-dioxygenase beta subunit